MILFQTVPRPHRNEMRKGLVIEKNKGGKKEETICNVPQLQKRGKQEKITSSKKKKTFCILVEAFGDIGDLR